MTRCSERNGTPDGIKEILQKEELYNPLMLNALRQSPKKTCPKRIDTGAKRLSTICRE